MLHTRAPTSRPATTAMAAHAQPESMILPATRATGSQTVPVSGPPPASAGVADQFTTAVTMPKAAPSTTDAATLPDVRMTRHDTPAARAAWALRPFALRRRPPLKPLRRDDTRACDPRDRKSTRLNSSHVKISYAVLCLQKK